MGEGFGGDTRLDEGSTNPQVPDCLRGETSEEVFDKLADGDPLGLERRALLFLDREGFVLPPFRLIQLSGAQIAFEALRYAGDPPLDEWVVGCINKSAHMLLDEQISDERRGLPVAQCEDLAYYKALATVLGVELELSRAVCLTINHLPTDSRRVFHAIAIQGRSADDLAAAGFGGGNLSRVNSLLSEASREILLILQAAQEDTDGWPL